MRKVFVITGILLSCAGIVWLRYDLQQRRNRVARQWLSNTQSDAVAEIDCTVANNDVIRITDKESLDWLSRSFRSARDIGCPPGAIGTYEATIHLKSGNWFECYFVPTKNSITIVIDETFNEDFATRTMTIDGAPPPLSKGLFKAICQRN